MADEFSVDITFMDGKTVSLRGTQKDNADTRLETLIERFSTLTSFPLVVDGSIVFYPVANIRSVELIPGSLKGLPSWMNDTLKRS